MKKTVALSLFVVVFASFAFADTPLPTAATVSKTVCYKVVNADKYKVTLSDGRKITPEECVPVAGRNSVIDGFVVNNTDAAPIMFKTSETFKPEDRVKSVTVLLSVYEAEGKSPWKYLIDRVKDGESYILDQDTTPADIVRICYKIKNAGDFADLKDVNGKKLDGSTCIPRRQGVVGLQVAVDGKEAFSVPFDFNAVYAEGKAPKEAVKYVNILSDETSTHSIVPATTELNAQSKKAGRGLYGSIALVVLAVGVVVFFFARKRD